MHSRPTGAHGKGSAYGTTPVPLHRRLVATPSGRTRRGCWGVRLAAAGSNVSVSLLAAMLSVWNASVRHTGAQMPSTYSAPTTVVAG